MILAKEVLEIFVYNVTYYTQKTKSKKDENSVKYKKSFTNSNQAIYLLYTVCEPIIITLAPVVLEIFCSQASAGLQ